MTLETMKTSGVGGVGSFLYFSDKIRCLILIDQFNSMDLNIEENTLKHQNVNVPTEYNISKGEK